MLQLILAGQPELEDKLLRTDLRQLRQRIAVSARLEPLSMAETADYIAYRLERAGCLNKDLFTRPAVEAIWSASKGSPRTINVLCDHALVTAFAMGMKEVEGPAAREAVNDVMCLRLREPPIKKPGPYLVNHFEGDRSDPSNDEGIVQSDGRGGRVG
jgi:general secretion pathway protein A